MASALRKHLIRQPTLPASEALNELDTMDRLDFDAWLLPPAELGKVDRCVRALSIAVGPVAFCAFAGAAALAIF